MADTILCVKAEVVYGEMVEGEFVESGAVGARWWKAEVVEAELVMACDGRHPHVWKWKWWERISERIDSVYGHNPYVFDVIIKISIHLRKKHIGRNVGKGKEMKKYKIFSFLLFQYKIDWLQSTTEIKYTVETKSYYLSTREELIRDACFVFCNWKDQQLPLVFYNGFRNKQ